MDGFSIHWKKIVTAAGILFLPAIVVAIILCDVPDRDVAHRYIPMAEAFASGDFSYAFHPRVQPLQPVCGGVIMRLTGIGGFLSLKLASALWHVAGGILLFVLLRKLYREDRKVAALGASLYLFFPYMFQMAYSGLRESAKGFFLILLALALVDISRERRHFGGYFLLGIAAGMAIMVRAEMLAISCFCLLCGGVYESESGRFPLRTAAASLISAVLVAPCAAVNFLYYGHAMPDVRFALIFQDVFARAAGIADFLLCAAAAGVLITLASWAAARVRRMVPAGYGWAAAVLFTCVVVLFTVFTGRNRQESWAAYELFVSILKGMYYFIIPVGVMHVWLKMREKCFRPEEHAVLLVAGAHFMLSLNQFLLFHREIYVASRYLFPGVPLFFGFFILGIEDIYRALRTVMPRGYVNFLLLGACVGLAVMYCVQIAQPIYREHCRRSSVESRRNIMEIKEIIEKDYRGDRRGEAARRMWYYSSRRRPRICFIPEQTKFSVCTYFIGGSATVSGEEADYVISEDPPGVVSPARGVRVGGFRDRHRTYGVWRLER